MEYFLFLLLGLSIGAGAAGFLVGIPRVIRPARLLSH
jgi:hypothetical protein